MTKPAAVTCTTAAAAVWPSGFVIVIVYFWPARFAVAADVLSTRLTVVGLTYVAEVTVGGVPEAAPFEIAALKWLNGRAGDARLAPGS